MSNTSNANVPECKGKIPGFCRAGCEKTSLLSLKCKPHNRCETIKKEYEEGYGSFVNRCGKIPGCSARDNGDQYYCINEVKEEIENKKYAGGATYRASKERVTINKQKRIVYVGVRGGKYVKQQGKYVPLAKVKSTSK